MPNVIYILASGPNGKESYDKIPANAFVIAVNQAVEIPNVYDLTFEIASWIVGDSLALRENWFDRCYKLYNGKRYFSNFVKKKMPNADAEFFSYVDNGDFSKMSKGKYPVMGTISATASMIAYRLGAKKIILIGCDMSGPKHHDGSGDPTDLRHGDVWFGTDEFNTVISWLNNQGVEVYTLSETKLDVPEFDGGRPLIAYLCMSHDPIDRVCAIHDALYQDYPNHLKTLYILRQKKFNGKFPISLKHNLPIRIVEIDVPGTWPELWLLKLMAFCEAVTEKITVWWDEDDRYPPDYTHKAIEPLTKYGVSASWSYDCIMARCGFIDYNWYRSPIGTLTIHSKILKQIIHEIFKKLYSGNWQNPTRRLNKNDYKYAKDDLLTLEIEARFDTIMQHAGMKTYMIHSQTNTVGDRPAELNLDSENGIIHKRWLNASKR